MSSVVKINDIFDELKDENKRLLNELIFADKFLNVLIEYKTFVEMIFAKYSQHFESQDVDYYQQNLTKSAEEVLNIDNYRQFNQITNKTDDKANDQSFQLPEEKPLSDENTETTDSSESVSEDNTRVNKAIIGPNTTFGTKSKKKSIDKLKRKYIKVNISSEDISKNSVSEDKIRVKNKIVSPKKRSVKTRDKSQFIESYDKLKRQFTKSRTKRPNLKNLCNFCGQELGSICERSRHSDIHSKMYVKNLGPNGKGSQYICQYPDCEYRVIGIDSFVGHINDHKGLKPFQCPTCDKSFKNKSLLVGHYTTHSTVKEFSCDWPGCEYQTSRRYHLVQHVRQVHSNERTFVCDWDGCQKRFKTRTILMFHKKIHLQDKRHACHWPGCQYRCVNSGNLKLHMITHSESRDFGCEWPECGKRFKTKQALDIHQRIHTNDKRYVCSHPGCDYRTCFAANIKSHLRVHSK